MPRVILYKGTFAYDAVNVFIRELAAGLSDLGREVTIIDLTTEKATRAQRVREALSQPFECIVSFAGIGFHPRSEELGLRMYSNLPAPFVTVLVDHPSCALELFAMRDMLITCYDRSHVAFLQKYLGPDRKIGFLPHGGSVAGQG